MNILTLFPSFYRIRSAYDNTGTLTPKHVLDIICNGHVNALCGDHISLSVHSRPIEPKIRYGT